jgi:methyl-accepting chemotaxis protein
MIRETVGNSATIIKELKERSQHIGQIVETITDIASQINLLALNAAIEAARAGEAGRGFAVVAEEVRKLAEGSVRAAGEITDLIRSIQGEAERAARSMEVEVMAVAEGSKVIHKTGETFKEIEEMVSRMVSRIGEISDITRERVASSDEITRVIDKIATVAENNAKLAKEVAASAQGQIASVVELASTADVLVTITKDFKETIAKFKV